VKFNDGETAYNSGVDFGEKAFSEARWRTRHSVHRNGDLYPTHGIGPVAQYININRGNRLTYLTSTATKSRGLHEYIVTHPKGGPDHPNASVRFELGDIITTVVKTAKGESIIISHDTNLPRPYSLGFRVQGTKGLWMDVNDSIHLEGISPGHQWEPAASYLEKHDHPLWQKHANEAEGAGHGGMDWFLVNDFVLSARNNTPPPIDVYDAATWLAITPLSEQSVASGSQPQPVPDFTRGRWMVWENRFGQRLAFVRGEDGSVEHVITPAGAADAVPVDWRSDPMLLGIAFGATALFSLTTWLGFWRRFRQQHETRRTGSLLSAMALLATLPVVWMIVVASQVPGPDELAFADVFSDWPIPFLGQLALSATVVAGTAIVLTVCLVPAWARSGWNVARRLHFTLFATAYATLAVFLVIWGLVPYSAG